MCTITFIPQSDNKFILTSNRDEAPGRETFPPAIYTENGVDLLYPKDAVAGGTWIGSSAKNRVVSIMNGGFVAHKRKATYRKSRGLVVKDLLIADDVVAEINSYNFTDIEPFTVIIVDWNEKLRLFQLVWDGETAHFSKERIQPRVWSSSPLYPSDLKAKREQWFSDFLHKYPEPNLKNLLDFHRNAGDGDTISNLVMDRGFVKTKSITQIVKNENGLEMRYEDLQTKEIAVVRA